MDIQTLPQTPLKSAISSFEANGRLRFSPTVDFYHSIGINRIRFWQLVKGKKTMMVDEAVRLSDFFKVPLDQLCINEKPGHYSR